MTLLTLLHALAARDIGISERDGKLVVDAPMGVLTQELRADLAAYKSALLPLLASPLSCWVDPGLTPEEAAALDVILDWPLDDHTSLAESIESGQRRNNSIRGPS
jgi:hypothetical protein